MNIYIYIYIYQTESTLCQQHTSTCIDMYQHINIRSNVRPALFYTKAFAYSSVAISLIKLLHRTVLGPSINCLKFQRCIGRTFYDPGG